MSGAIDIIASTMVAAITINCFMISVNPVKYGIVVAWAFKTLFTKLLECTKLGTKLSVLNRGMG